MQNPDTIPAPEASAPDVPVEPIMPYYQSHKIVQAALVNLVEIYQDRCAMRWHHRGRHEWIWESLAWYRKHQPEAPGYYVIYPDGYTSWSPPGAFETGYKSLALDGLEYGGAIDALRQGKAVRRDSWHEDVYVFLLEGKAGPTFMCRTDDGEVGQYDPDGDDMLADNWTVMEIPARSAA